MDDQRTDRRGGDFLSRQFNPLLWVRLVIVAAILLVCIPALFNPFLPLVYLALFAVTWTVSRFRK